jgi:hypothetical protein
MKWNKLFLLAGICLSVFSGFSQEEENEKKNSLAITFSYAFVPKGAELGELNERGHFVPGLGLDYFYRPAERWSVGFIADLELAHYIIPSRKELERERALLFLGMGGYELAPKLAVLAGAGLEYEKHESLFVLRAAAEYEWEFIDDWYFPLGVYYDFKTEFDTWGVNVGLAKRF